MRTAHCAVTRRVEGEAECLCLVSPHDYCITYYYIRINPGLALTILKYRDYVRLEGCNRLSCDRTVESDQARYTVYCKSLAQTK